MDNLCITGYLSSKIEIYSHMFIKHEIGMGANCATFQTDPYLASTLCKVAYVCVFHIGFRSIGHVSCWIYTP